MPRFKEKERLRKRKEKLAKAKKANTPHSQATTPDNGVNNQIQPKKGSLLDKIGFIGPLTGRN